MGSSVQRIIVVSAVNVRKGGTLTIQRDCLQYLSELSKSGLYRVYALVHKRDLYGFEGIEYIEFPDTIKSWGRRLWCEYVTMRKISKTIAPVYLWLSMHDTTPNVIAEKRAVYCQTSFPFYKWNFRDIFFDYKIVLFALFTRFAYRINIHKNDYLIAQQQWFEKSWSELLRFDPSRIILCPPQRKQQGVVPETIDADTPLFFYASTPDCHKNFQLVCEAARILEKRIGRKRFNVVITLSGDKNRYDRWLYRKWGNVASLQFSGFLSKERLYGYYQVASCLIFPSKVETWGLPISEYMDVSVKPMILADLPYAHETAVGDNPVAFVDPNNPVQLADIMEDVINGRLDVFSLPQAQPTAGLIAYSWADLFEILLK